MTTLPNNNVIVVSRFTKFLAFSIVAVLTACVSDETSRVDSQLMAGSWSGETDGMSWCIDMTEDKLYRHVQYSKSKKVLVFQSGRYELQRGKRILIVLTDSDEGTYRAWSVNDKSATKRQDLFVVTDVSNDHIVVQALYANPQWRVGVDSVSQRVHNCDAKVEELKMMAGNP